MNMDMPLVGSSMSSGTHATDWRRLIVAHWPLLLGGLVLAVPTMITVATTSWSTEQGAHGPIVLATGLWLIAQRLHDIRRTARPASLMRVLLIMAPVLLLYGIARVTDLIEIEGVAMYAALLVALYACVGGATMRLLWFPLFYLVFVFPPPDTVVAMLTQPLKIGISRAAVGLLHAFGLPVARTGVIIQVAQYDVLVAAACAGLNSIISLSAIGSFYIYLRHNANWRYALLLIVAIVPVAIFSNFIRVVLLILITYWFGDAAAQGFLHEFAGIIMFLVALGCVLGIDMLARPLRQRLAGASA